MHKLNVFPPGYLTPYDMNYMVNEVNFHVDIVNSNVSTLQEKKAALESIQSVMQEISYKYKPSQIAASPEYREAQDWLFNEIQQAYISLAEPLPPKSSPLASVIANMSPTKANELFSRLLHGTQLTSLYHPMDNSYEAKIFRHFLSTHEISFLGGSNSKNYKVVNKINNTTLVMKIDNRLDMPKNAEAHLRRNLDNFSSVHAERQVTCMYQGSVISRSLLITDYCTGGDLFQRRKNEPSHQVIESANTLFAQMAKTMLNIAEAGCIFPDAKNTNWLVENNNLVLADTKSFVFAKNGTWTPFGIPGNEYSGGLLRTHGFTPPEFNANPQVPISVDATHAYILGKNLYCYVTGQSWLDGDHGANFNFNNPQFNTPEGQVLKNLIIRLVHPNPTSRMSVKEAHDQLSFTTNKNIAIANLNTLKNGHNNQKIDNLIFNLNQQINSTPGITGKINAVKGVTATLALQNELGKGHLANLDTILNGISQPGVDLNADFGFNRGLTLAEQVISSIYNKQDVRSFNQVQLILQSANIFLNVPTIQKISQTYQNPRATEEWFNQLLITHDPQQALINEFQRNRGANEIIRLIYKPEVKGILHQQYPFAYGPSNHTFYLSMAEQAIATTFKDAQGFNALLLELKKTGITLNANTLQKISKTFKNPHEAEEWFLQQLVITQEVDRINRIKVNFSPNNTIKALENERETLSRKIDVSPDCLKAYRILHIQSHPEVEKAWETKKNEINQVFTTEKNSLVQKTHRLKAEIVSLIPKIRLEEQKLLQQHKDLSGITNKTQATLSLLDTIDSTRKEISTVIKNFTQYLQNSNEKPIKNAITTIKEAKGILNNNIPFIKEHLIAIKQVILNKSLEDVTKYYDCKDRFHFFKAEYKKQSGDDAKRTILDEFKKELMNLESPGDLDQFKQNLTVNKNHPNYAKYQILATAQGLMTKISGGETSSVAALNIMMAEREATLLEANKLKI